MNDKFLLNKDATLEKTYTIRGWFTTDTKIDRKALNELNEIDGITVSNITKNTNVTPSYNDYNRKVVIACEDGDLLHDAFCILYPMAQYTEMLDGDNEYKRATLLMVAA